MEQILFCPLIQLPQAYLNVERVELGALSTSPHVFRINNLDYVITKQWKCRPNTQLLTTYHLLYVLQALNLRGSYPGKLHTLPPSCIKTQQPTLYNCV